MSVLILLSMFYLDDVKNFNDLKLDIFPSCEYA